jgi:hypothetical protein
MFQYGRGNAILAVGLYLVQHLVPAAENETVDDLFRYEAERLLTVARLPGLHHRQKPRRAQPLVEGVVERRGGRRETMNRPIICAT